MVKVRRLREDGSRFLDTLRGRILAALILCGLLPVAIIVVSNKTYVARTLANSEVEKYEELSTEIARQVASIMASAARDLLSLGSNPVLTNPESTDQARKAEMDRLVSIYGLFQGVALFDSSGLLLIPEPETQRSVFDSTDWLITAARGEAAISKPERVYGSDGLYVSVYLPVEIRGQRSRQVLKANLPFHPVWELLAGAKLGREGYFVLLDSRGNILFHPDRSRALRAFDEGAGEVLGGSDEGVCRYQESGGREMVCVKHVLDADETRVGESWTLLALVPEKEILSASRRGDLFQLVAACVTVLFAVMLGLLLSSRIGRPIQNAALAAEKVARGNMHVGIRLDGTAELRALASAFNQMVEELAAHRKDLEDKVAERTRNLRESQAELERLSAQLEAAFESTKEAVLLVRRDGVIIAANRHVADFFQVPAHQLKGRSFDILRERFFGCFEGGDEMASQWDEAMARPTGSLETEWTLVRPNEMVVKCYSSPVRNRAGDPFAQLWMFADVTRERELQRGLEQAQKMEAIGRLAGGIAHDFNNLLTGIIGNLSLAEMEGARAPAFGTVGRHIETAKTAAARAAELVRQLLGFSRRSHLTLERCEVNSVIEEVRSLLEHTVDPRIEISLDLAGDVGPIRADGTQVQQVLMNLCVNARDAIDGAGVIRLRSSNVEIPDGEAGHHGAEGGAFVRVDVEDSGKGMPADVLAKIFEPFFTTKEPGKGTGLGLATSYGIVKQHGGWIECLSEPGQGTRFSVFFPRNGAEAVEPVEEPPGATAAATVRGTETVLLVDDDLVVRAVAENVLRHHGYRVACASDGQEGVDFVREHAAEVDLVLLDLTMPRLSGRESFRMMREMRTDLPVVICSGYLVDIEAFAEETGYRPEGIVQKPYDVGELARTVRTILDAAKPAARARA